MTKFHNTDQNYSACIQAAVGMTYWQTKISVNVLAFVMEGGGGVNKMILAGKNQVA